jgi:hypothetical protein
MPKSKAKNSLKILFIGITLVVIGIRLELLFSHELILGTDGGYYPLQVRKILTSGFLGFSDLPLYFYFCAAWLKLFSFFGFALSNQHIIMVIKVIDSVALPLLAIPLYFLIKENEKPIPILTALSILLFSIISYAPLAMLGDIQKNAFAIPLAFLFIYLIQRYLSLNESKSLIWAFTVWLFIGISHFGVFMFTSAFAIILLFIVKGKKAIIPALISMTLAYGIIALFDLERALRLLHLWDVIFENHFIWREPLFIIVLLNCLFSYSLCTIAWFQYRKFKNQIPKASSAMLIALILVILIFVFPMYEANYVIRFQALLFMPQGLLIFYLIKIRTTWASTFSMILLLFTLGLSIVYFNQKHEPAIEMAAYHDLQNLNKSIIKDKDSSIVIARHGIEFWTAFALGIKVANDRAINSIEQKNYKQIIFLNVKEERKRRPNHHKPIGEPNRGPMRQNQGKLIYHSKYLDAFELKNTN